MKESIFKKTIVVWFGALICCLLWGSAFPCIKLGYAGLSISSSDTATQILYAGYRFTLAGIMAIIMGSLISRKLLVPKAKAIPKVLSLCLFQTVIQYLFFYIGLANTDGTKASVIEGMNVFVAIIIASLLFRQEKLTLRKIIGCIVGFAGVILINLSSDAGFNMSLTLKGEGFIFFSTISYAFSSVLIKRYSKSENALMLSGWQFVLGGIIMIISGLMMGGNVNTKLLLQTDNLLLLLYLAFISAAAYSLWSVLLTHNPISKVAVFGFMNPVFGFILSAILLNEGSAFSLKAVASLALVCTGIYVVNKKG